MPKIVAIQDFKGGLNTSTSTTIEDNQFKTLKNMYYNENGELQTRRGIATFGTAIGANPITSYFFYQRDDDLSGHALCVSGDSMYKYNGTSWDDKTGWALHEYETIPGKTTQRTRRDWAVYKNNAYMCNGVDPYLTYDSSTAVVSEVGMVGAVTCTFDHTTDIVINAAHGLVNGDEVRFTNIGGAVPVGITVYQFYYVVEKTTNNFKISTTKGGTAVSFSDNGTGTSYYNKAGKPRLRYISYLADRLFAAGDDGNPNTLYYTNAAPTDGTTISQNAVVVGGDENGRINGLSELGNIILGFKGGKIYSVDVATPAVSSIDAMNGAYSNRAIRGVGNSLVYFSDKGVETLKQRSGVSGAAALESSALSDNVSSILRDVTERQYNSCAAFYDKATSNYFISVDTNNDNIPDTTLVYSALTKGRSQFTYPSLYDYGIYIDSSQIVHYIIASGTTGQTYEIDIGYSDNGVDIEYEAETKDFDFGSPGLNKTYDFVDITGLKAVGCTISIEVKVDGISAVTGTITDSVIDITAGVVKSLGTQKIGMYRLTGPDIINSPSEGNYDVDLYRFTYRLPFYAMGEKISVNMQSASDTSSGTRILEKMRISKDDQPVEVFKTASIG